MLHSHILRFYVCFRQAIKTESKLSQHQELELFQEISFASLFSQVFFGYPHAFNYTPMKKLIFAALIILEMPRYWTLKQRKYARRRSSIVCSLLFFFFFLYLLVQIYAGREKTVEWKKAEKSFLTWIKFYEKETEKRLK